MQDTPNIRHLEAFIAASRSRNLGRAAEAIHLSQPATTQALRKLEADLGHTLFDRSSTGLSPTEAGNRFRVRVDRAFDCLRQGQRVLNPSAPPLQSHVTRVQLRALIAIVDQGSYSSAARQLGVSQPGVHRAARDLEALCGQRLFSATPQGLEVTAAARELARCAALAIAEINQGIEELREMRGNRDGRVWIGCLPLGRTRLLPHAVTKLLDRYPEAKIRIVDGAYDDLLHELRHGQIDFIFGALREPSPASDVIQEAFFSDPLSIIVRTNHPILSRPRFDAESLAGLDWVVPRGGTPARDNFDAFFAKHSVNAPKRIIECSSLIALRALLMESDRAGLLSAEQVQYEVEAGFLAMLPHPLPDTERPIGIAARKNWQPTIVQADLIDLLRRLCLCLP